MRKKRKKIEITCPSCGRPIPISVAGAVLGAAGGRLGGIVRARKLTRARRKEIASMGGKASKGKKEEGCDQK